MLASGEVVNSEPAGRKSYVFWKSYDFSDYGLNTIFGRFSTNTKKLFEKYFFEIFATYFLFLFFISDHIDQIHSCVSDHQWHHLSGLGPTDQILAGAKGWTLEPWWDTTWCPRCMVCSSESQQAPFNVELMDCVIYWCWVESTRSLQPHTYRRTPVALVACLWPSANAFKCVFCSFQPILKKS